ncbi:hypothetical protein DMENIID0001_011500 [Sergentomyia squamirostris]
MDGGRLNILHDGCLFSVQETAVECGASSTAIHRGIFWLGYCPKHTLSSQTVGYFVLNTGAFCELPISIFVLFQIPFHLKTFRSVSGNVTHTIIAWILTIYMLFFMILVMLRIVDIFHDNEATLLRKIIIIITLEGFFMVTFKDISGAFYQKKFQNLVDWTEKLHTVKEDNHLVQKIVDKDLEKTIKFGNILFKLYGSLVGTAVFGLMVTYVVSHFVVIKIPYFESQHKELIYLLIQEVSLFILAIWDVTSDSGIIFLGLYMLAFVKIINKMIKALSDQKAMIECPNLLLETMKKHREMIEILETFNSAIKLMSFTQLLMSTITFLTLLFSIQIDWHQFLFQMIFIVVLVELFLLCLFGEIIKCESASIFWNLYLTKWYEMSLKDQKIILIMMMNSQKEIGLKAVGMYDISLMAFIQILKMSFSYSAIILTFTKH